MSLFRRLLTQPTMAKSSLRSEIIEDLCNLISARSPVWCDDFFTDRLKKSIIFFGVSNIARSQGKYNSNAIVSEIEQLIASFEPRLTDVYIQLIEPTVKNQYLHFSVNANLLTSQGKEPIAFDSQLDFNASQLSVTEYYYG